MKSYLKKTAAFAASLLMLLNTAPIAAFASAAGQTEETERPQREREGVYAENKIVFSTADIRKDRADAVYLDDGCALAKKYGLSEVTFVFEAEIDRVNAPRGKKAYEVFYEANVIADDVWALADKMKSEGSVLSAEPDIAYKTAEAGSYEEPTASEIYCVDNYRDLNANGVWRYVGSDGRAPGEGVVVAVIDSGIDYKHPDLAESMWVNTGEIPDNGIDDDGNGYVDDIHGYDFIEDDGDPTDDLGHGTHVAGIIAMSPGNGGGVGLAYGAKLMAVKAAHQAGILYSTDIARAVKYAADNGADVINMSFGGELKSSVIESALRSALSTSVLVASAGNSGSVTKDYKYPGCTCDTYPAGYDYVIGVMASDGDSRAGFSNWDWNPGVNCSYEVFAEGVSIYSTIPGNRYASWNGTSMSAPIVSAAAAILRSCLPDKSRYSSRYIMGQINAATEKTITVVGTVEEEYRLPKLDLMASLTKSPRPELSVSDVRMFDTPALSENNNGDGIAQPGETIALGVSVKNKWGAAKNVVIKADARSSGGIDDPFVEFITDEAAIGGIGTYSEGDNGFVYSNGAVTDVERPLLFRVADNAPNDLDICINLTASGKNALDEADGAVYSSETGKHRFRVQKGVKLSGVISADMTLTNDKYWIIENNLLVPENVTLTIEPGARIQFWSAEPVSPYFDSPDVYILVEGRLICEGTQQAPIELFPCESLSDRYVYIKGDTNGLHDTDETNAYVSMKYTSVLNPGEIHATYIDHCSFDIEGTFTWWGHVNALRISNSRFYGGDIGNADSIVAEQFIGNLFSNCTKGFTLYDKRWRHVTDRLAFENNAMVCCRGENIYKIGNSLYAFEFRAGQFTNNAFLPCFKDTDARTRRCFVTDEKRTSYDVSGNYWGSEDEKTVKSCVYDADVNVAYADLVQEPFLTLSDDMSSIYPFLKEAYLTDRYGSRTDTIYSPQKVTLHAVFNRAMDSSVLPVVTFGGTAPYTDYAVNGSWYSDTEWRGEVTIDRRVVSGTMYIRVKDAAAADDPWLGTGVDAARFFFNVRSSSALSITLQGVGAIGANELSWSQDDHETLAGYNLYRSVEYDPSVKISEQSFERINPSIILGEDTSFSDSDVEQGVEYFYYFTVVDTELAESEPSNVVSCIPTDTEPPVITHTAVTSYSLAEPLAIDAAVTDNVAVDSVVLRYRVGGDWTSVPMRNISGSAYRGIISAYELMSDGLEYYITATDGRNTALSGSEEEPYLAAAADEHRYEQSGAVTPATCTENGAMTLVCADCGLEKTVVIPPEGHTFSDEWTIDAEPSCEQAGERSHRCTKCGERADITDIPAKDHSFVFDRIAEAPACESGGKAVYKCADCGCEREETIPASGHSYTETAVPADCERQGYTEHTCAKCGVSYRDNYTQPLEHDFVKAAESGATCTAEGSEHYECSRCGKAYDSALCKTGHSFTVKTYEPRCDAQGYTEHVCSVCGYSFRSGFTPTAAHDITDTVLTEATCTTEGAVKHECTKCGMVTVEKAPPLSHDYEARSIEATCTSRNCTEYTCKRCGESFRSDLGETAAHDYYDVVTPPTCAANGFTEHICKNCGRTERDTFTEKLSHEYEERVTEPTCTEQGFTEHICKGCGSSYKDSFTDAVGHRYSHIVSEADCMREGYTEHICEACGYRSADGFTPISAHSYTDTVTGAACELRGYTEHKCSVCGSRYIDSYTDALGHDLERSVVREPSCTENGEAKLVCRRCGKTFYEETPANGHQFKDTDVPASCTERGCTEHKCTVCGETFKDSFTDKSPHRYTLSFEDAPTCTSDGKRVYTCSDCGACRTETLPMTGHDITDSVKVPSCTEQGYTEHKCKNCGLAYRDSETEKTPHSFGSHEVLIEPTADTCGVRVLACSDCGVLRCELISETKGAKMSRSSLQMSVPTDALVIDTGDVDGDGEVTSRDALLALRHSVGLEQPDIMPMLRADADGDRRITSADAHKLLMMSCGKDNDRCAQRVISACSGRGGSE